MYVQLLTSLYLNLNTHQTDIDNIHLNYVYSIS